GRGRFWPSTPPHISLPSKGCANCASHWLPFGPGRRGLSAIGTMESRMSKAGLDNRHRNHDGEISHKHGNAEKFARRVEATYPTLRFSAEVLPLFSVSS